MGTVKTDERVSVKYSPETYARLLEVKASILRRTGRNLTMDKLANELLDVWEERKTWSQIR